MEHFLQIFSCHFLPFYRETELSKMSLLVSTVSKIFRLITLKSNELYAMSKREREKYPKKIKVT